MCASKGEKMMSRDDYLIMEFRKLRDDHLGNIHLFFLTIFQLLVLFAILSMFLSIFIQPLYILVSFLSIFVAFMLSGFLMLNIMVEYRRAVVDFFQRYYMDKYKNDKKNT